MVRYSYRAGEVTLFEKISCLTYQTAHKQLAYIEPQAVGKVLYGCF